MSLFSKALYLDKQHLGPVASPLPSRPAGAAQQQWRLQLNLLDVVVPELPKP